MMSTSTQSSDDDEDSNVVVMDLGSNMTKTGLAGDDSPRSLIRTAVGVPIKSKSGNITECSGGRIPGQDYKFVHDITDDNECFWRRPMERGIVTDWDLMEELWRFIFAKDLRINPDQYSLLVTEHALNPKVNSEKVAELAFETFNFKGLAVVPSSQLSVYANGRVSGLAVDSGDGVTHTLVIYEGYPLKNAINRIDMGGYDVTLQLQRSLFEKKGWTFTTASELALLRQFKERESYVAYDYDTELEAFNRCQKNGRRNVRSNVEKTYTLPDGTNIQIDQELFQCYEVLFQPQLFGQDTEGLLSVPDLVSKTLEECPSDTRADLLCNVLLSGSTTMAPGFRERMTKELSLVTPSSRRLQVIAPPERRSSVWIGGSILGSLSAFPNVCVSKQMYDEYGPHVIHRF